MNRKAITLLSIVACSSFQLVKGQQITVSGKITDTKGQALSGVTISNLQNTNSTQTSSTGLFSINVPSNSTLVVSLMGYKKQEIPLNGRTTLQITLDDDEKALDEVVVTALGIKRNERSLGYAAQRVDASTLTANKQTNVVNALQGKVAGVTISSTGGAPGQGRDNRGGNTPNRGPRK